MTCGSFDHATREYVIATPKTPTKWINYVGTLAFGGFVDQCGGGVICKGDPALNRIVKYFPQLPLSDFNGETLYCRLGNGERMFSAFYTPTLDPYEKYECRVGLGYSRFETQFYGIAFEITVFVPVGGCQVLRRIRVTNRSGKDQSVDLVPVVEYTHFDALKQLTNADWVPQTMQSRVIEQGGGRKILTQCAFLKKGRGENYFTANVPVSSYDSDRAVFLGDGGYGSWSKPAGLRNPELANSQANRGDNIGALLLKLGTLKNGETRTIITQLGQYESVKDKLAEIERYRSEAAFDAEFARLKQTWDAYLSRLQVKTPSDALNAMINVHNARQCSMTKNWSRDLSLYQLGFGGRGTGFRDSSQDSMGILANSPEEAGEFMTKILHFQKRAGNAMHQFFLLTMTASEGDSQDESDRPDYYGDDHLWIVLAVSAYVKETGDFAFLKKSVPFYEKDANGKAIEEGTVLEHLKRALTFTHDNTGSHGLPLLGFADWNDTINLRKGAESVMIANQYGAALREMIDLMRAVGETDFAATCETWYDEMKDRVNRQCWDGAWWVRYFDFDGTPIGTHKSDKGKIFINSQTWAVLSGFAEGEKAVRAMDSVNENLNTKNGIKLSWPGYDGYDPNIGGVTTYPPGAKENGGIFLHTNPWAIIAETMLGRGDRAFEYYMQINPAAKNEKIEEYEIEPYCYAQNILGDEHPQFGLGRNSWLSGTASWMFQAATKHILGVRPACDGLVVDPCIPKDWDGFTITRGFRGETFEIVVKNPDRVNRGVKSITMDGKAIAGKLLPVGTGAKSHKVEVVLG